MEQKLDPATNELSGWWQKTKPVLKRWVLKGKDYLESYINVPAGIKATKDFWECIKEHPESWRNSEPDKAFRAFLGRVLLVVYGVVFVFGVVIVNCKDMIGWIGGSVSNVQVEKDLRQCKRDEDVYRKQWGN